MRKFKFKIKGNIFPAVIWTVALLWCLIFFTFIVWGFITSVKSVSNVYAEPLGLPKEEYGGWLFSNYKTAFNALNVTIGSKRYGVLALLGNSLLYSVGNAFLSVLTACIASYILAKYNYIPWVKSLWGIVLIQNYLPIGSSLAGNIEFLVKLGLYDSLLGNWLWGMGAFGYVFMIYYASWKSVAWDYAEAAFIDGASHFRAMVQVMWPMTATIFGVLCLTQFISLWNDYMVPVYYLPSYPTMAYGAWLFQFNIDSTETGGTPIQLAGLYTLAAPIVILFIVFKDKLMGSLTLGGLKG